MASRQRRNQQHIVLGEKRSTTDLTVSRKNKRQKQKSVHVAGIETSTSYTTGKYINSIL